MERTMTSEEICRHYRLAADKRDDIVVLADLNMTSREEIERILTEGGELVPEERKQRRTYNTKRGAEIEERLRKGQSVEHIARNMDIKEASVLKWIKEHGKEDLMEKEREDTLPPEEEARRMEEKRKRMIREKKKEAAAVPAAKDIAAEEATGRRAVNDAEGGRKEAVGQGNQKKPSFRLADKSIMDRMDSIIGAVPADAEWETRTRAFSLCGALFREWLQKELNLTEN